MTCHESVRPSTRNRICKVGAFTIVTLMLLGVAAQGEILAVCGDAVVDMGEACDLALANGAPGSCCTVGCTFQPSSTICRAAGGACDFAETCTGSSDTCPADVIAAVGTICRGAMDEFCDLTEICTGMDPSCPPDDFQSNGTACPDDGSFCSGVEVCVNGICQGSPLNCNDGDPCTYDFCNEQLQGCSYSVSPDQETAAGQDSLCDTTDDNLSLYGVDEECGTPDDLTGDGLCNGEDNCDLAFNPPQQDTDNDGLGDSCDATPCLTQALFATSSDDLFRLDAAAGTASLVESDLSSDLKDVAVDAFGNYAAVSSFQDNTVAVIALFDPSFGVDHVLFDGPWGIDFGASGKVYVIERNLDRIGRFLPFGNTLMPVPATLSSPTGLDVNAAETFAFVTEAGGALRRVNITTGAVTLITSGLSSPQAVALNAAETSAYVVEAGAGRLSRVDIAAGTITIVATGLGSNAQGLALNADETQAYVTVSGAPPGRIMQVDLSGMGIVGFLDFTGAIDPPPFSTGVTLGPRPPVRISLADNSLGSPPTSVVSLVVDDLTGLGVLSADLTLRFNPDVATITTIADGSLVGACNLTSNFATPGFAAISIFCTSPLSGAGSLAEIIFSISGTAGQGTPLDIVTALLNEGDPAHCADDGTLFIPVEISGTVLYYRDHLTGTEPSTKPVDNVNVELHVPEPALAEGYDPNILLTTSTDCSGDYALVNLAPIQPYTVFARKTNDFLGVIDPFDAALNAQHVVGLTSLTIKQRVAADASGNGSLTSFDSARIAQLSVGLIAQLPVAVNNGSDWTFIPTPQMEPNQGVYFPIPAARLPGRIEYLPLAESAENQDFLAILYGDVSGNWQGICPGLLPPGGTAPDAAMAPALGTSIPGGASSAVGSAGPALIMPSLAASKGQTVRVPIRARDLPSAISFYMDLRYDPSVVRLIRVENGAATATKFSFTPNITESGRARVALFSTTPLNGTDSEIAVAVFEVVGTTGSVSPVSIAGWTVNEGRLPASVNEGSIRVLSRRNPPLQ